MIVEPGDHSPDSFDVDVCIVGSGAAGISLALELDGSGLRVLVLAGGTASETPANQDLNRGVVDPAGSHEPLEESRRRAFGGSSIVWGGRCVPLDAIDFERRPWVAHSGWPMAAAALEPHYRRAADLCRIGDGAFFADATFPEAGREILPGLDDEDISSNRLERWSPPVNFARDYRDELAASEHVTVLLDAHLLEIRMATRRRVAELVGSIRGRRIVVKARHHVLACGGIDNPRVLLASKGDFYPQGIGNDHDLVGRYYMSHLSGIVAEVSPSSRDDMIFDFESDPDDVDCRRRWWITPAAQRRLGIGNAVFYLHRARELDGHRDVLFSSTFVAKFLLSIARARSRETFRQTWRKGRGALGSHLRVIARDAWWQLPDLWRVARRRFGKRRLPFVLPSVHSRSLGLYFQTEQVPNRDSRVLLSDTETDRLGMPRAIVRIAFSALDRQTVLEAHRLLIGRYAERGLGGYVMDYGKLSSYLDAKLTRFNSSAHHLGTTRMSDDPAEGVVDADCKVHGIDDLFVLGSSVFPTGGHANPTLTIVALASRLAGHLSRAATARP